MCVRWRYDLKRIDKLEQSLVCTNPVSIDMLSFYDPWGTKVRLHDNRKPISPPSLESWTGVYSDFTFIVAK